MPFPLGSYQGLSFAIPPFSLPCLSTSKLFFSILRPSLSYPFFTLLFYAFSLLFNALPSPFMSIHCHCLSCQYIAIAFHVKAFANQIFARPNIAFANQISSELRLSKSSLCLSSANHRFAVHCLAVPLRTDSFLRPHKSLPFQETLHHCLSAYSLAFASQNKAIANLRSSCPCYATPPLLVASPILCPAVFIGDIQCRFLACRHASFPLRIYSIL